MTTTLYTVCISIHGVLKLSTTKRVYVSDTLITVMLLHFLYNALVFFTSGICFVIINPQLCLKERLLRCYVLDIQVKVVVNVSRHTHKIQQGPSCMCCSYYTLRKTMLTYGNVHMQKPSV